MRVCLGAGCRSNLKINHQGKFSDEFRREHKTSPEMVPWWAGVNPAGKA